MSDAQPQSATNPITELKVTAHLMAMEPGLYCVYNTPGTAAADGRTGLPGVRITAAPGGGGFPGQVAISGFNTEGWLGGNDGAVLVRIGGGPAQVLVTVYQSADGAQDAPKLQVIRLSDQPAPDTGAPEAAATAASAGAAPAASSAPAHPASAEPGPEPEDAAAPEPPPLEVAAHIYGRGDVAGRIGDWMGEPGSKCWVEGFGLVPAGLSPADIEYQAVLGRGWLSPWAEGGQFCGSRGMSLPILGLRVRLRGAAAEAADLHVSATFVDGTRIGPVTDGGALEAPSLSPLEAFQVTLHRRAAAQPSAMRPAAAIQAPPPAAPAKPRRTKAPSATPEPPVPVKPVPAKRASGKAAPGNAAPAPVAPEPPTPAKPVAARRAPGKAASSKAAPSKATTPAAPEPSAASGAPAPTVATRPPAKRAPATTRRR